ncbi:hypothetical protein GXW83_19860 [Streptacidiphilus sp. PB12-B1b]|uniref:hypothetical protein n=1 Tax=Streptacidiphilus sp. PB12-B1b TaxID=2705012 RepID=UPI0015FA97F2|nr:hypothetical protein [Streptacidiphilus sp. PB12-B1b]QMU77612.1 hypothetical protein GXW83_19860 [Streptacidiphilus sp. PB12-B1b]
MTTGQQPAPSGGFAVQVDDFAAVAPKFAGAGTELASAVAAQSAALQGLGSFWGTTAHGPDFGAKYQPLAVKVLALARMSGIAVEGVGDGLQQMGQEYGVTEAQITAAMKSLQ